MNLPHVHVVSTGLRSPFRARCEASVASQTGVSFDHEYIEAGDQDPPLTKMENLRNAIVRLDPETPVALVDGDDMLSRSDALAIVAKHHAAGAWVTIGSFQFMDGRPGFAAPYKTDNYRMEPWCGTHLKTFRAGLFQRLREDDLKFNGEWIDRADDPAFMFGVLEQAGKDRIVFCPEILYHYDLAASFEWSATQAELAHERAIVAHVRGLKPYERLESL